MHRYCSAVVVEDDCIDELKFLISDKNSQAIKIDKFPCHTQSVERHVKLVTEAAAAVCRPEARDGFIRSKIKARGIMPKFETKKRLLYFLQYYALK